MEKAQEIVDLDGAGKKLAMHGSQFGKLVDSYVASVNTCFAHMGVSVALLHVVTTIVRLVWGVLIEIGMIFILESRCCWRERF